MTGLFNIFILFFNSISSIRIIIDITLYMLIFAIFGMILNRRLF